jgi:hypothetical protein
LRPCSENGLTVPTTLNDSAAARDFDAAEKITDLPRHFDTTGSPSGTSARSGDITYYSPRGNLALFYRDFGHAEGLVTLGHIDGPLDALTDTRNGPTVNIAVAEYGGPIQPASASRGGVRSKPLPITGEKGTVVAGVTAVGTFAFAGFDTSAARGSVTTWSPDDLLGNNR